MVESNGQFPDSIFFVLPATFDLTDYSLASWNNFFPRFTKHHIVLVFLLYLWLLLLSLFCLFLLLIPTHKQKNASQDYLVSVTHSVSWLNSVSMPMTPSICLTETFLLSHLIPHPTAFSLSLPWNLIDTSILICPKLNFWVFPLNSGSLSFFSISAHLYFLNLFLHLFIYLFSMPLLFWLLWPDIRSSSLFSFFHTTHPVHQEILSVQSLE